MNGGQKTINRANCKGQLALAVIEDWKRVAWSDESQFRLLNADGRPRIWREAHEGLDPTCQVETVQGHGGSIMVCGVFCGTVWDLWCVYQPSSMQFDTQSSWVITSIRLCCSVIPIEMEFSSKTTVPLTSPGWLLAGWMRIPLTFLS
ncbi:HTH_Tnp_Tc3_2 domain-containing protein [Trichonephila clavipes]|nr:HTH_Tnp_Tc3_2 domain-containing protein [Trichonephila clavipes]